MSVILRFPKLRCFVKWGYGGDVGVHTGTYRVERFQKCGALFLSPPQTRMMKFSCGYRYPPMYEKLPYASSLSNNPAIILEAGPY